MVSKLNVNVQDFMPFCFECEKLESFLVAIVNYPF